MSSILSVGVQSAGLDSLLATKNKQKENKSDFEELLTGLANDTSHMDGLLGVAGSSEVAAGGLSAASVGGSADFAAIIGSDGPLPTYLRELVAAKNLNAEQTHALYEIAARNMNVDYSPETVQRIGQELQQAGIA